MRAAILGAVVALVAAGASLHTNPLCACLSVAQAALTVSWYKMDEAELERRVNARYAGKVSEAEFSQSLGAGYRNHCHPQPSGRAIECTFPHDSNAWRRTHAQTTIRLDEKRVIESVRVVRQIRYAWE